MPDVNDEDRFVPGMRVNERPQPEDKAAAFLEEQLREARRQQRELDQRYPYMDGGKTVLGPEVFTDGAVISWKGENYVLQSHVKALRDLRAVAAIHCSALLELLHDEGIRLPESALRVYMLLYDELTLTMPALARAHPAVLPRLPEGME